MNEINLRVFTNKTLYKAFFGGVWGGGVGVTAK